jgi:hypothetical protein
MRHDLKRPVGRLLALVLLSIGAVGLGQTGAADNSARTLTIGAGSADALDPRNPPFNAIPNDGQDDREALQRWIDAGCASVNKLLYLPPGDWHVTRRPLLGSTNIGSLQIACDGLTILGAGRKSRIVMQGSGVLPASFRGPGDWWVFEIRGKGVTIEGIAIDGSQRVNTGEQTHLVQILGPAQDTELRRLYLDLPILASPAGSVACKPAETDPDFKTRMCAIPEHGSVLCKDLGDRPRCSLSGVTYTLLGWFTGGDCIRSVGELATPVDGVTVADSFAAGCSRSFIGLQRASRNFTITGNVTKRVSDQIIDQEPTGSGTIGNVLITGNRLERGGAAAQGAFAITLTGRGSGAEIGDAMVVANNLLDGGIATFNVARVSIEHNIINGQASSADASPVVSIIKVTESLRLIGNEIVRPTGAHAGDVIGLSVHNTGWPNDVTIALNTITQNADGHAIRMLGAQNVTITGNTVHCNQPTAGKFAVVGAQSEVPSETRPPLPLDGLMVSQNRARGQCKWLVLAEPIRDVSIGSVSVIANQTKGFNFGVQFLGNPTVKPRISDNLFEGTAPANFVQGPPGFVFDGSNGPQP